MTLSINMVAKLKRSPIKLKGKLKVKRTPVTGPLCLVRKDPRDNTEDFKKVFEESKDRALRNISNISSEYGYIENLTETNLERTHLYEYQRKVMTDHSRYRHIDKSRQVGISYEFACEGFAKSQLLDIYTAIFISFNQDEANNKIVYAKSLDDSVPHKYKKKLVVDRITAMEWEGLTSNGRKTKTRLISHPQREPRGKGYNTDVYLDEFAHFTWPEKVYIAAVPIITRGFGQLCLASSPLGKSGMHYKIGSNVEDYNMYSRHKIFWWDNPDFLNADAMRHGIDEIGKLAVDMQTYDRVMEFGNSAVQQAYHSMLEEYFQQEYELKAIDESTSYYPMDLIKQCTFEALKGFQHLETGDLYGENPVPVDPVYPGFYFHTFGTVEELSHAIATGKVGKRFVAGFDVGRKEDYSEIIIMEEIPSLDYLQVVRLMITMKQTKFRKQYEVIDYLFNHVPIFKMKVDSTGLGSNIAEDLQSKYHSRIEDVVFNAENKGEMAANLKLRMEDQSIAYPNNRDLLRQIHSLKRKVSDNSTIKFEVDQSDRKLHHGDKFWALALASASGRMAQMHKVMLITSDMTRKGMPNARRMIQTPDDRSFAKTPLVFNIDYKKQIPVPEKLPSEFDIGKMITF